MTKIFSNTSKVSKARLERIKRREARLADATTTTKLNPTATATTTICKTGSLKSLASLAAISPSLSLDSTNSLGSPFSFMTWKYLAPCATEAGGRDQPIDLCSLKSLPGSPVKTCNVPPIAVQDKDNHDPALSTLNEFRVLHTRVIQGLMKRVNAIKRGEARRRAIHRKKMTPNVSTASFDFSVEVKSSSTPPPKVGARAIREDVDATLVSSEFLDKARLSIIPAENSDHLTAKADVSSGKLAVEEPVFQFIPSSHELTDIPKVKVLNRTQCDRLDSFLTVPKIDPKEELFSHVASERKSCHPDPQLSPRLIELPDFPKELITRAPFSSLAFRNAVQVPSLKRPFSSCEPGFPSTIPQENLPPLAVKSIQVCGGGKSRSKKPLRYRDKIPKPVSRDLTWPTQAIPAVNADATTVRNVVEYFREASLSNAATIADPSLRLLHPLTSPGFNFEHPFSPIASSYHSPILENRAPVLEPGTPSGRSVDGSKLERQELTHGTDEPSLLSSLETVSYLMDLMVFPIKLVWRMAYGA